MTRYRRRRHDHDTANQALAERIERAERVLAGAPDASDLLDDIKQEIGVEPEQPAPQPEPEPDPNQPHVDNTLPEPEPQPEPSPQPPEPTEPPEPTQLPAEQVWTDAVTAFAEREGLQLPEAEEMFRANLADHVQRGEVWEQEVTAFAEAHGITVDEASEMFSNLLDPDGSRRA
jgi:hypothetical protein